MAFKVCLSRGLRNQYIAALAACLTLATSATCYGWMTPLLDQLMAPGSDIPMTPTQEPWVVSVIELGNVASPLPAGLLVNHIGRKPIILACGPIYILSWIIVLYFRTALALGIARVIQGFAMGLTFTATPVYLGEIASNDTRGAITSILFNSWWVGFIIEYIAGPFLSFDAFTYFTLILNIPSILFLLWQPESPYFYMLAEDEENAKKSLQYFRDTNPEKLDEELDEIRQSIAANKKKTRIRDVVATPADRKAFFLLMTLTSVRLLSGTGAILVYSTQMFSITPNIAVDPNLATAIIGVIMLIGGCFSAVTSDTLGRRTLLMVSSVGGFFCQFFTAIYYFLLFKTSINVSQYGWVAPSLVFVYSGLCSAGMYPVCSSYTSELFTSQTRGIASSFSSMAVTIASFIVMILYPPITYYFGLYFNFCLYSLCLLVSSFYFYFSAPETKGKSFVQIRRELGENIIYAC